MNDKRPKPNKPKNEEPKIQLDEMEWESAQKQIEEKKKSHK